MSQTRGSTASWHLPRGRVAAGLISVVLALLLSASSAEAAPPTVSATWTTAVTATSASLHAEVNPEGIATTYRFQYLTEAAYEANLGAGHEAFAGAAQAPPGAEADLGPAATAQPALQPLEHLTPATAYRYRIVATSHCNPGEPAEACEAPGPPHAFATEEAGVAFALPDHRGWELVSPPAKNGGAIQGFGGNSGGGVLQAAADGEAITYSSSASFGAGAQGAPTASQYIARRVGAQAGWSSENITFPTVSGAYGNANTGVPYQLFSTDLARGLLLNGRRCGGSEPCPHSYSLRDDESAVLTPSPEAPDLRFAGASPDLRHLVLSTCAALTAEATEVPSGGGGCVAAETNLYQWSEGQLSLINDPSSHHAALAAQSGAISSDGRRVYFTAGEDSPILLREGGAGVCGIPCAGLTKLLPETVGGGASFQAASTDGSLAFFTKAAHLYRYNATAEASTDLTPGGEVQGVLGAAADGSRVYYLTSAGLFLWQAPDTITEIAPAAPAAFTGDYPPSTGSARVSADGAHLAFLSTASLSGYDNTDQASGEPDTEVYLYEAPTGSGGGGTLTCTSCNPTGERPLGPSTIPGAIANGDLAEDPTATDSYKPRDLSENGERLFFDSSDALVPADASAAADVYEWEARGSGGCQKPGGCLGLISSGQSSEASSFIDASADGSDAFFLTGDSLVPRDPGSVDLYDARENGGIPEPTPLTPCDGDACQSVPSPPEDPAPGTIVPGPPNPPAHFPKPHHKKPKHKHGKKHHKNHRAGSHR